MPQVYLCYASRLRLGAVKDALCCTWPIVPQEKTASLVLEQIAPPPAMPSIRDSSHLYSMEVDAEINAVRFRWREQPTGEEFRYGANRLLKFVRSRTVSGLIVDTRNVTAHHSSSVEWIVREWIPDVTSAGIEHVAVVHQDDLIARTEMETLNDRIQQAGPAPFFFTTDSPTEARRWIAERDQSPPSLYHLVQYLSSLQLFSFS